MKRFMLAAAGAAAAFAGLALAPASATTPQTAPAALERAVSTELSAASLRTDVGFHGRRGIKARRAFRHGRGLRPRAVHGRRSGFYDYPYYSRSRLHRGVAPRALRYGDPRFDALRTRKVIKKKHRY